MGFWNAHGRHLEVNADGSVTVNYRSYVSCGQSPTPPCDQIRDNTIVDGGHVTLRISQVVTARHTSTATAIVQASSDPSFRRGSVQAFLLNGNVITWAPMGTFCGQKAVRAEIDTCGA